MQVLYTAEALASGDGREGHVRSFDGLLEADLAGEYDARTSYKKSREICQELGDYVTMKLFEELLADEEGHIDFLETQLDLLASIGEEKYGLLNAASADDAE